MKRGLRVVVVVLGGAVVVAAIFGSCVRQELDIDSCLDRGGRWDDATKSCEGAREYPGPSKP